MISDSNEIVKKVSSEIISRINPEWTDLQKIRFVYIELGKYLEKNTDFFLNKKMTNGKMSSAELLEIYQENIIGVSFRDNFQEQYQVICRSAALFLKTIYDELGIESQYVYTLKEEEGIRHWFLAAKDGADGKFVFLTLAADLANIKNNFPTEHFANNILYEYDGIQYYDAPSEIDHKAMTPQEIEELDFSLGYTRFYPRVDGYKVNVDLDPRSYRDLYYSLLVEDSEIYRIFQTNLHIRNDSFRNIDDISDNEFASFLQELESFVMSHTSKLLKVDFPHHDGESVEEYIRNAILTMMNTCNFSIDYKNLPIKKLIRECKKRIPKNEHNYSSFLELFSYLLNIHENISNFISIRGQYEDIRQRIEALEKREIDVNNASEFSELLKMEEEMKKHFDMAKKRVSILSLKMVLNNLAYFFIKDDLGTYKNGYVSAIAISKKLQMMFPIVFDACLEEESKTQSSFSIQGYSEQVVTIKRLLRLIFAELKHHNSSGIENYDEQYSPVDNRIQIFPLKNRDTGEYCIGFNVIRSNIVDGDEDQYYIYIPSSNCFKTLDLFAEATTTYQIVSSRFNKKLEELEESRAK